jgi:hypothetical protein
MQAKMSSMQKAHHHQTLRRLSIRLWQALKSRQYSAVCILLYFPCCRSAYIWNNKAVMMKIHTQIYLVSACTVICSEKKNRRPATREGIVLVHLCIEKKNRAKPRSTRAKNKGWLFHEKCIQASVPEITYLISLPSVKYPRNGRLETCSRVSCGVTVSSDCD